MKPTKEQFEEYVRIRDSGITNMFDTKFICTISTTGLTRDLCLEIMQNFGKLAEEYGVKI